MREDYRRGHLISPATYRSIDCCRPTFRARTTQGRGGIDSLGETRWTCAGGALRAVTKVGLRTTSTAAEGARAAFMPRGSLNSRLRRKRSVRERHCQPGVPRRHWHTLFRTRIRTRFPPGALSPTASAACLSCYCTLHCMRCRRLRGAQTLRPLHQPWFLRHCKDIGHACESTTMDCVLSCNSLW